MSILTESPATVIPNGTWAIDPVWSSLEFEVKKLGLMNIKGRVPGISGTVEGGATPSISGTVDPSTITTFDETRDGHLQSPDFFDTQRYPELRFESTAVEARGDELVVEGELTIKNITKPVELPEGMSVQPPIRGATTESALSSWAPSIAPSSVSSGTLRSRAAASCSRTRWF